MSQISIQILCKFYNWKIYYTLYTRVCQPEVKHACPIYFFLLANLQHPRPISHDDVVMHFMHKPSYNLPFTLRKGEVLISADGNSLNVFPSHSHCHNRASRMPSFPVLGHLDNKYYQFLTGKIFQTLKDICRHLLLTTFVYLSHKKVDLQCYPY